MQPVNAKEGIPRWIFVEIQRAKRKSVAKETFSTSAIENERDSWGGSSLLVKSRIRERSSRQDHSVQFVAWIGSRFRVWFSIFRDVMNVWRNYVARISFFFFLSLRCFFYIIQQFEENDLKKCNNGQFVHCFYSLHYLYSNCILIINAWYFRTILFGAKYEWTERDPTRTILEWDTLSLYKREQEYRNNKFLLDILPINFTKRKRGRNTCEENKEHSLKHIHTTRPTYPPPCRH